MKEHKYQTGQYVHLTTRAPGAVPNGRFQVVRQMPPENSVNQYRVRSVEDGHERMVKESDLS